MDSAQPHSFTFSEGISLYLACENQDEIDYFWSRLSVGGSEGQCGWLKDRFGVRRVVEAFMKMRKFDIAALVKAQERFEPSPRTGSRTRAP